ncbi:MarR family transcriptional regulator [Aurantimonas aggregata]|uniref:MarR family transcriptional regulator n=1 Tax=Aurantimonas aggregata TaxID=2047720 RepID=A0A6L9MHZ9_9HYPH|nr:MarR family transcriptional regulator [Aurantimonas aggregata]NDV87464.1 MarR family transcriptional regulator [Aurantimonas aggregata]
MTQLLPSNSLGFLLVDAARLFRQSFEKAVVEAGLELTPGEIRALAYVARFEGTRQAVLAERMGVEPMTLSAYLDRLEARGLISRTVDPSDRRAKVVRPTEAADKVFTEVRPVAMALYEQTVDGFSEDERVLVDTLLQKIRANLTNDPQIVGPTAPDQALPLPRSA